MPPIEVHGKILSPRDALSIEETPYSLDDCGRECRGRMCVMRDPDLRGIGQAWYGVVDTIFARPWMDPKTVTLANIMIFDEYRGNRYGHVLLEKVMAQLEALGYGGVKLGAKADNVPAIIMYQKQGFMPYDFKGGIWLMYRSIPLQPL